MGSAPADQGGLQSPYTMFSKNHAVEDGLLRVLPCRIQVRKPSALLLPTDSSVQRKTDFVFKTDPAMQFSRIDRNRDDRSRALGVGGSDSFEIFLGGQMGVAVDLIMEDGGRTHFCSPAARRNTPDR